MCRYAMTSYKPHYACFNCQKTFKRRLINDIKRGEKSVLEAKCPECGELMANMGLDFESPKKDDLKKWQHIKSLYSVGIAFHSCGCTGPGYIPNSKEKLIEYFEELKANCLKNIDFWRIRIEPTNKVERDKDNQRNWAKLGEVSSNYQKEIVKNQEGIDFWLKNVQEIENKISLIK
jgi:DNA-directed RNA polymerase subunit RPC12/RpoP